MIEAEEVCNKIGILNKGNLVALDTTKNLLSKIKTKKVNFKLDRTIQIKNDQLDSLKMSNYGENEITLSYDKNRVKIEEIIEIIKRENVKILDMSTDDGDLEDVFIRLTKN